MRRSVIAASWLIGTTVPLLAGVVFVFGCCVLPFHGVLHKVMPICERAVDLIRGESHEHHAAQQPLPAREKQEPAKRIAGEVPRSMQRTFAATVARPVPAAAATAYRSFITLGAVRCDRDVGLHLLDATLLI